MDIATYFSKLRDDLDHELSLIPGEGEFALIRLESAFMLVDAKIKMLKEFVLGYEFASVEEEINFFKKLKPDILSLSLYYGELFSIESNRPIAAKKLQKQYLLRELVTIQRFMRSQQPLYNYMLLEKTNFDTIYFLRGNSPLAGTPNGLSCTLDERFCTVHCMLVARIKACTKINTYLHREIEKLKNGALTAEAVPQLNWTGPKVYLVELIYALKAAGMLNGGNAEIKEIALFMDSLMPRKLTDYYRTFQEIRLRKKNRTVFLDLLRDRLNQWMEEAEGM